MDSRQYLRVIFSAESVAEPGKPGMQLAPEVQPARDRQRQAGRSQRSDIFMPDHLALAPRGNTARLQSASGISKPHEHPCSYPLRSETQSYRERATTGKARSSPLEGRNPDSDCSMRALDRRDYLTTVPLSGVKESVTGEASPEQAPPPAHARAERRGFRPFCAGRGKPGDRADTRSSRRVRRAPR